MTDIQPDWPRQQGIDRPNRDGQAPRHGTWRAHVRTRIAAVSADARAAAASQGIFVATAGDENGYVQQPLPQPTGPTRTDRRRGCQRRRVQQSPSQPADAALPLQCRYSAILQHLNAAQAYVDRGKRLRDWFGFKDWVTGTAIEGSWVNVHAADAHLLLLQGPTERAGRVSYVLAEVRAYLPEDDPRRFAAEGRFAQTANAHGSAMSEVKDEDAQLLACALRAAHFCNAEAHERLRRFRNILLGAAAGFMLLAGLTVGVAAAWPAVIPLCFPVDQGLDRRPICPVGRMPGRGDVLVVALMGLLGASVGAVRTLSRMQGEPRPYPLAIAQALLKAPLGVVLAIVGVVVLRSGIFPGFGRLDDRSDILVWAFVFGLLQQLLTGLIERRGEDLLKQASPDVPAGRSSATVRQ